MLNQKIGQKNQINYLYQDLIAMNLNLGRFLNINKIMLFKKKVIAIIPAKYNSSELSKKNFLKLKNKSLFEISIIAALKSNFIDEVFVSSDSNIILKKSKKIGAQIIKRNRNLSSKKVLLIK